MRWIIGIIIIMLILSGCQNAPAQGAHDDLAKCLSAKGVKMYGTFWCPKCAKQKALFGSSFQYITNIECDPRGENPQPELCLQKRVENYPHWEWSDGTFVEAVLSLEELKQKAGC